MWNDGSFSHMHDFGGFFGLGHGLFGFHGLLWLVLIIGIGLAVFALVRDWRRDRSEDTALSALGTRYARGEIDRDAYLAARKDLETRP